MTLKCKAMVATAMAVAVMGAGCAEEGLDGGTTCSYGGKSYAVGESFKSTDGCNTCSCLSDGTVACTLMACLLDAGVPPGDGPASSDTAPDSATAPDVATPDLAAVPDSVASDVTTGPDTDSAVTCSYGGKTYNPGESFNSVDGCNTCDCNNFGRITCTLLYCPFDAAPPPGDAVSEPDGPEVCLWGDASVPVGQSVFDGCNTCSCGSGGFMMCTERACPPADAAPSCTLSTGLTFGTNGGMVIYQDEYRLDPKTGLAVTRTYYLRAAVDGATVRSCAPPLPACGDASTVSLANIVADLDSPDVQAAFQKGATPLFGLDERPVDGTVYSIALDGVGTILVGYPCRTGGSSTCVEIPAGVQRLADDLRRLAADAIATEPCTNL